ncbi:MAG TPA: energy transducer TonB [Thiobacillaceae bacterium]|nr:energy transducer TonB [Thiobacillaceae bacterium]
MATETAPGAGFDWRLDSPWRRLPITLPGAVLVGLLGLWAGAGLMPGPEVHGPRPPAPLPLDARLIELPPPPLPPEEVRKPKREPPPPREESRPAPEPPPVEVPKTPASLAAPPAPSAEEWQLASTYTLKNGKRYRNAWGQQVRSMMGTAVEGPDQGQVRFRITINPDGSLARAEELWSTSAKASELARKAIQAMPPLPPTPGGKPLVFEQTISFLPYETGWPPSYKYDCLPDPPAFRNPFAWDGASPPPPSIPPAQVREERSPDCHPSDITGTFEEEDTELKRQIERNRWGR